MGDNPSFLTLPSAERTRFEKNFIKTAVCELRFPALLEYETRAPVELQRELRKEFPHYDRLQQPAVSGELGKENIHQLKSKKGDWIVSFKSASIALQTNRYTHFEEFRTQLEIVINKSKPLLDTDFFTRVGLRYINEVHLEDGTLEGWVNHELIAPVVEGVYGPTERFLQEVRGTTQSGKYTFRHGIEGVDESKRDFYVIDFDFWNENVEVDEVVPMVTEFNRESFRFFLWAIGPKAKERMGRIIPERDQK